MTIVVTGATGKVGGDVARRLAAAGVPQRLLVRDPARAPRLEGAEVVRADYTDPASVREALWPGDRVFMVATHQGVEDRIASHRSFIQAAADVGVGLLAYLSMVNASADSPFPHSWSHRATEDLIRDAGMPFAFLRMNMFLDDLPLWFDPDGVCRGPAGDGRVALISRADVGAVTVAVLAADGYHDETLDLSGDEAPTVAEFAAICSEESGRDLRYEPGTRADYIASRLAMGRPPWDAEAGAGSYLAVAAGELGQPSDVVRRVTGRDPERVRGWAAAHREAFARTGDRASARPI
jgi:NAD(P)H dehydrogenase (quinone)